MILNGTILNIILVALGSMVGLAFKNKLPSNITKIVFQALGLFTLYLGIKMALEAQMILAMVFSLIIGGITGEWLKLESRTENFFSKLKRRFKFKNEKFTEGLITSFLMFCMGSMTILGAIQEGMDGDASLLYTKSVMDGFSSIALSAALGAGVLFSIVPLFLYQGALTLTAYYLGNFFNPQIITELTATGGVLLIGLGINILAIKKIKVFNLLPSLLYIILFSYLILYFQIKI